jgi:hypothetical protein
MHPKPILLAFLPLLLGTACDGELGYSFATQVLSVKQEVFPADGVRKARLETGAGKLEVRGRVGAASIEVRAEFKGRPRAGDEQRILDNLELKMEVRGDTFYLKTGTRSRLRWNESGWIDLTITVPPRIALDVDDASGSISVSGIDGDVMIEDGSGEVDLDRIQGEVVINDGSGSITVRDVGKSVRISDGSGGISVRHIQGNVTIEDGSGSIEVEDVRGNLDVPRAGSGSVRYRDVQGTVQVPRRRRS